MTQNDSYNALMHDITRILTGYRQPNLWSSTLKRVLKMYRNQQFQELLDLVNASIKEKNLEDSPLQPTFRHVSIMLQADARQPSALRLESLEYTKQHLNDYINQIAPILQRYEQAALGYHALELAGSQEALKAKLTESVKQPVKLVVTEFQSVPPIREKIEWRGAHPWLATVVMPTIIVSTDHSVRI